MSRRAESAKRKVKRALKLVPKEELERVVEEVAESAEAELDFIPEGSKPGDIVNGYKVGWTWTKMKETFPLVIFTPEETIPLSFNGVRVQAIAQVEMKVPEPFKRIYDQHRKEMAKIPQMGDKDGFVTTLGLGLGGLEPPKT